MSNDILTDIVKLCLALDQKSSDVYARLSSLVEIEELKHFWKEMSDEETTHVEFWKRLVEMAENRMLPQVFDNPEETKSELEEINNKVNMLWKKFGNNVNISDSFILAYRMEFYLLHPALATLFHYMKGVETKTNPEDTYESHIEKFIDTFRKYGGITPELELLGETLQSLWKKNRELAHKSSFDELTEIFNRRGFFDTIKPLLHLSRRNRYSVGIMMTDIDDFKKVNDTYGHQKGDDVLKTVAKVLKSNVRGSDIVGRYGGEEFIIFFYAVDKDVMCQIADTIRKKIEKDTKNDIPVTVSIGISQGLLSSDVENTIITLIGTADACLYRAKGEGKNRVVMD
jgi:diguanylate cyclase (GGDEF)-like protein